MEGVKKAQKESWRDDARGIKSTSITPRSTTPVTITQWMQKILLKYSTETVFSLCTLLVI
jgi:hypothetical protein